MSAQLDAIITISNSTPRNWVHECRRSVHAAAQRSPYPVNIIEVPGVPGHIGNAMRAGLQRSSAEYVAWIDDDDLVLPNAFACLERHFAERPSAICAREIRLLANGTLIPNENRHHLTAYRRDQACSVRLEDFPSVPNIALQRATQESAVDEWSWVYIHRIRRSPGMALRASSSPKERELLR